MSLFHAGLQPALDSNGDPISGATWNFYRSETLTALSVYSNASLSVSLGSTVTADAAGRFAVMFLDDDLSYRAILKSASGTTIKDIDPINPDLGGLVLTPEMYGCVGDGTTDDYDAWVDMVEAVNDAGGGTIRLSGDKNYYLGQYITASNGITSPAFADCDGVTIEGNGATISVAGDFDRAASTTQALTVLWFRRCSNIIIRNLEIDGNVDLTTNSSASAEPSSFGIRLMKCTAVTLVNVYSHHHAADGIVVDDDGNSSGSRQVSRNVTAISCRFTHNARQGMSVISLRGGMFLNCDFSETGQSTGTYGNHSPAAGVDIEPQRDTSSAAPDALDIDVGDIHFVNCTFLNNKGCTFLCGGGKRFDNIHLLGCRLEVGSNSGSADDKFIFGARYSSVRYCEFDLGAEDKILYLWPNASNLGADMDFIGNNVRGAGQLMVCQLFTGRVVIEGNKFIHTGTVNTVLGSGTRTITVATTATNVIWRNNWVWIPKEIYNDATGTDVHRIVVLNVVKAKGNRYTTDLLAASGSGGTAHFGIDYASSPVVDDETFVGQAAGTADTMRPMVSGAVRTHNTNYPFNIREHIVSATWDPPSLADGAQQSTTVTVTGAVVGDMVHNPTFSNALSGTQLWGEVTAADTVTVYHRNDTGGVVDLASGTLRVRVLRV